MLQQGGYHVPLALGWSEEGGVLALPAGAGVSRGGGGALPIVKPSLDPSKEGTCFSESAISAGFVEEEALGIVGKPSPSCLSASLQATLA